MAVVGVLPHWSSLWLLSLVCRCVVWWMQRNAKTHRQSRIIWSTLSQCDSTTLVEWRGRISSRRRAATLITDRSWLVNRARQSCLLGLSCIGRPCWTRSAHKQDVTCQRHMPGTSLTEQGNPRSTWHLPAVAVTCLVDVTVLDANVKSLNTTSLLCLLQ